MSNPIDEQLDSISVPRAVLDRALDWLCELRGEWEWSKDEIRCHYKERYRELVADIEALQGLLKAPVDEASLPTVEDIQKIYAETKGDVPKVDGRVFSVDRGVGLP